MLRYNSFGVVVALLIFMLSATGCDALKSIKDYFQEPAEKSASSSTPSPTAPVQVQVKPQPTEQPMGVNTLARVGNWSITIEEFNDRLNALKEVIPEFDVTDLQAKNLVLEELINQQVLVTGAEQTGLAENKDIKAAVDEFRRTLIVREVARELTEGIVVSEEMARAYYDENKASLVGPDEWHVREIVAPTKPEAMGILTDILNGADFAETAKLRSKGKTAASGGDLGFITQEPFPEMAEALLPLKAGEVSDVIKGPDGFYIVKLEEKKAGAQLMFEDIKDDIIQGQTVLKQQQAILSHLDNLKAKIKIETNEQLIQ